MAHKSNGYIYTDDAVPSLIRNGALTFYNRLEHRVEQAATLVIHEEKHELVFTESEVRAMIAAILRETEQVPSVNGGFIDIIFPSNVRGAVKECGIVLDPA